MDGPSIRPRIIRNFKGSFSKIEDASHRLDNFVENG